MNKYKYKAVIFDYDDTLVESRLIKFAQHKAVAKKFYNIQLTDEELLVHWGKPLNLLISELYKYTDTPENMMKALLSTRDDFEKKVYEGSVETINQILARGIKVGVLSATTKNFLMEDLKRHGFPVQEMAVIQGSDETSFHKPNGKVFIPLIEKLKEQKINKKEIVYVGDSSNDLQATQEAGIAFIAVTTGLYSEKDFKAQNAKVVISNIKEVLKYI